MDGKCFIFLCFLLLPHLGPGQTRDLDYFLKKGLETSPDLKDINNQILANYYDSLLARAEYLPRVSFNSSMMYAPVINGWGYSEVITNGQELTGTININQQFLNKKVRETRLRKYSIQGISLENSRKISEIELRKAITAQYLTAYLSFQDKQYQKEILSTLYVQDTLLRKLAASGIYKTSDLLALQVEIMSLERYIRDLDMQYRKEFMNLNIICGIRDTTGYSLTSPALDTLIAAEHSLFLRKFYYDSLRIQNDRLLVDLDYKPRLSWFSDGGIMNNQPSDLYKNFGISLGLSLSLPIYDGNQRRIRYGKLKSDEEIRKIYRDYTVFKNQTELFRLSDELKGVINSGKENKKQVALIEELIRQYKILLNAGSLGIGDYILALKSLTEARHNSILYQIRAQYLINEINLLKQ